MNDRSNGVDLLRIRPIRTLILWWGFPYVFQVAMLLLFIALAVIGWGRFAPEGVNDKLFAKTNIVNLIIWGLWWPTMVWVAVLFGRAWCMVCPLELVANLTERLARRLGVKQHVLGKWLRSGALILGIYALIQMLIAGVHLHRVPAYTSLFLFGLLISAAITGLLFKDRAFCRGFCPVGLLLNIYGRGSMLAVRAASDQKCRECVSKDCILACHRHKTDGRSCPSLLNPPKLNSNKDCLVCGQCFKACQPDNLQLVLRRPFHPADTREPSASWPLTFFVMLVSGFVTYELCTEWNAAKTIFLWVPDYVTAYLGFSNLGGWIKGIWMLFVFPTALWLLLGGLTRLISGATTISEAWRRIALPVAVIVAAGHMAKGLAKINSWAGFLPHALNNPFGVDTVVGITDGNIPSPTFLLPPSVISIVGLALIMTGLYFAVRESRLANPIASRQRFVPKFALAVLFAFIVWGWG